MGRTERLLGLPAWAFGPDAHKGNAGAEDVFRIEGNQVSKQVLSEGEETLALHLRAHRLPFEREVHLISGRKWRWDFVVGDLAIEVQGQTWTKGAHSSGSGILRDCQKLNAVVMAGYRPLVFTTQMVNSGYAIDTIQAALRQTKSATF